MSELNERKERKDKGVKRGRTAADVPAAMQTDGLTSGSREETAHSAGRPARISMGNMKKLEVPSSLLEDGYYHRWFQDRDGRISRAQAAFYEHVVDEQGNNYSRPSGPYSMHLMRLPMKYREEDLELKRKRVAATLESEAAIGADEYAPDPETGKAEGGTSAIRHKASDA